MFRLLCSIALEPIDWIAIGLAAFIVGGLLVALVLYLRTAFKDGGWKNVKRAAWIAVVTLSVFAIFRIAQNQELAALKNFIDRLFK